MTQLSTVWTSSIVTVLGKVYDLHIYIRIDLISSALMAEENSPCHDKTTATTLCEQSIELSEIQTGSDDVIEAQQLTEC